MGATSHTVPLEVVRLPGNPRGGAFPIEPVHNTGFADLLPVFAKIDGENLTAFRVERATRGVSTGPEGQKLGITDSPTRQPLRAHSMRRRADDGGLRHRRAAGMVVAALAVALAAASATAHEGHATGPHPTGTPTTDTSAAAPRAPVPVTYRVLPGAHADLGWTGISHDQPWPSEQRLAFALDCNAGDARCAAVGGARGDFFGAPVPLSSGGVPACVVNRLRTGVGGTVDPKRGCGELQIYLTASIYTAPDVAQPCPVCGDDTAPNDGKKDGRCRGGSGDGQPCDAQSASPHFGATSNDCAPAPGTSAGELTLDVAPLTTETARLEATLVCKVNAGTNAPRCFCPAQVQANPCIGDRCAADGRCPEGPVGGTCSTAPYRDCRPGSGREDCDALAPGSGECRLAPRPCFGESIAATGRCDPQRPTYVAVFCTPQTRATALNAAAGLPGPSRLVLPLERVE